MRLVGLVSARCFVRVGLGLLGCHQTMAGIVVHEFDDLLAWRHLGVRRVQFLVRPCCFYLVLSKLLDSLVLRCSAYRTRSNVAELIRSLSCANTLCIRPSVRVLAIYAWGGILRRLGSSACRHHRLDQVGVAANLTWARWSWLLVLQSQREFGHQSRL